MACQGYLNQKKLGPARQSCLCCGLFHAEFRPFLRFWARSCRAGSFFFRFWKVQGLPFEIKKNLVLLGRTWPAICLLIQGDLPFYGTTRCCPLCLKISDKAILRGLIIHATFHVHQTISCCSAADPILIWSSLEFYGKSCRAGKFYCWFWDIYGLSLRICNKIDLPGRTWLKISWLICEIYHFTARQDLIRCAWNF